MNSVVNGSGLNDSVAGDVSRFLVVLRDSYQYPSPIELEWLQVDIVHESGAHDVQPSIYMVDNGNDSWPIGDQTDIAPSPSFSIGTNDSAGNWNILSSIFDVVYNPEKSGIYAISVFCGNIPLNGGRPFRKRVNAGEVNMSLSGIVNFSPKVPKMIKSEIVVQLMDAFSNPILLQQSKLKLEIASINKSGSSTWDFSSTGDGLYTGFYLVKEVGTYEICASFAGKHFLPCPFGVNAYSGEYFPKAYDDQVSVWEDQSDVLDVLENDYLPGGNASIIQFSKPAHGSLLQYGHLYRYTPYKGFVGNDSFSYTVSDANGNLAIGAVNISVLSIPPQLVSFPSQLQATEDVITPKFGGFHGFEVMYSDLTENISVTLTARHGTVSLSPMLMQFWQTLRTELSLNTGDGKDKDLTIRGRLEVVNYALQSIQYLGNENFYGDDSIHVCTMNGNGVNDLDVPIFVEPVNDPPFFNVPEFIILQKSSNQEGHPIFDKERDKFNFSVGDPDLPCFHGNKSLFLVMFSLEVDSGFLSTNLPAELIGSTELKLKTSYQWQPLQTFVTISRHFMVKARGIRFRGTVDDCNIIMQDLLYHGEEHGAVLTVEVNDMGNYGRKPDCMENMSVPLFAQANIHLIRTRPMSSLVAHALGSAIVIESILVFSLGVILLYFSCKCAIVLVNGKKSGASQDVELHNVQNSQNETSGANFEHLTHFEGWCSTPLHRTQFSTFRQRSG